MKLKIKITNDDITNGKRESASQCPLAYAIKRMSEIKASGVRVEVRYDAVDLCHAAHGIRKFFHTERLKQAIHEYDRTGYWPRDKREFVLQRSEMK